MEHCGTSVDVDEHPKNNNYFSGTFVQGKESTVIFNVKAKTSFGEQVFIVGNCGALGDWDIHHAAKMKTDDSSYPIWCASLQLDQGRGIEYKYIIRGDWDADHVIWETGTNRKLGVHGLWMVIDDSHFGSGTKELVKCVSENGSASSSSPDTLPSSSSSNRSPLTHSSSFGSPISLSNLISFNGMSSANPPSSSNQIPPSPFSAFPNGNNNERLSSSQERPQPTNESSASNSLPRISRYHMFNNSLWNNLNEQLEVFSQLEAKHLNEKTKLEKELADIKLQLQASEMALQKAAKELAFLQGKDMKYFSVTELKKLAQISNSVSSQANDLIIKKLEDYVEFAQSQQECVACMDRPIDTIIQPCGHYVVCTECGTKVGKCPVCNVKITKLQKVFPK